MFLRACSNDADHFGTQAVTHAVSSPVACQISMTGHQADSDDGARRARGSTDSRPGHAMELSRARCRLKVRRRPGLGGDQSPAISTTNVGGSAAERPRRSIAARPPIRPSDSHNFAVGFAAELLSRRQIRQRAAASFFALSTRRGCVPTRLGHFTLSGEAAYDGHPRMPRRSMNVRVLELPSVNQRRFACGHCGLAD